MVNLLLEDQYQILYHALTNWNQIFSNNCRIRPDIKLYDCVTNTNDTCFIVIPPLLPPTHTLINYEHQRVKLMTKFELPNRPDRQEWHNYDQCPLTILTIGLNGRFQGNIGRPNKTGGIPSPTQHVFVPHLYRYLQIARKLKFGRCPNPWPK